MIQGVQILPLPSLSDERGTVFPMLRRTDAHFQEFGEIFFASLYPEVVRGWHLREHGVLHCVCVVGEVKLALYDEREGSPTRGRVQVAYLGRRNRALAVIPPGIWSGFMNVGTVEALVALCSTVPEDPAEVRRLDPHRNHIPYDWSRKNG